MPLSPKNRLTFHTKVSLPLKHFASSYCPYTDKKEELPCELGYYSIGNASSCEICPPGYECPFQDQAVRYFTVINIKFLLVISMFIQLLRS